ncbi:Slp family lipoprotein [Arhodomonas sp. SL1]|uniref:Slp family lipoprotein n=1 Tax=Arhodomonas sp. SL1 TaxID=3425691 RepID=UPI003F884F33
MGRLSVVILVVVWLGGCAMVPEAVRDAPPRSPAPEAMRAAMEDYGGERVRWGGEIVEVINRADHTLVAVSQRPLDAAARPREDADSGGRLLARFDGFLDPAVYAAGRDLTITGRVVGLETRPVGEYPYRYVVVEVDGHNLWPPRRVPVTINRPVGAPPYWWDCFGPWDPYCRRW